MKNGLAKNGAIVFILTTLGSVLNYLCQLFMGRLFSIENFGVINTIFSLVLIVSVIGNTAFMLMSKQISENSNYTTYKNIIKIVNKLVGILLIILLILWPIMQKVVSPNPIIIILTIVALITSIYPLVYQGVFGGLGNFTLLGLYTLIIPIIKILCVLMVWLGSFSNGLEIILAIISLIVGNVLSLVVGYFFAKMKFKKSNNLQTKNLFNREYKTILLVNILIMFLMNIDVLYLSYYFEDTTIGLYSSVLIFGKMVYYFVTALVTVMLPLISKNSQDSKYAKSLLNQTLAYTLILTIFCLIPMNIFAKQILNLVFGSRYLDAISYVKFASFISVSYSLNVILFNYLVGIGKLDQMKKSLIIGSILAVISLIIFHKYQSICLILIGLINSLIFIINFRKIKKETNSVRRSKMKYLYFMIGTEAELMKMYKVIEEAKKRNYVVKIISSGQNIIFKSPFLKLIDEKVAIDLTKFAPKRKGIKYYLKWFWQTRKYGIKVLKEELKDKNINDCLMFVHGDTLTTLMGSLIARKVKMPYIHVESGFRSHNWFSPFPEEMDRYFSSKKSIINFCQNDEAQKIALKYFKGEAVNTIYNTIIETLYYALDEGKKQKLTLPVKGKYFVFALHRQENLLNNDFMQKVCHNIIELSKKVTCVFIYHEQTKEAMERCGVWTDFKNAKNIKMIPRQDYINFINIVNNSLFVIGDGCGNQQEFYYLGKPYLILRTEIENNSEGLNKNAIPFAKNYDMILTFDQNYKKFMQKPIKMKKRPSVIIMDRIDKLFFK